MNLLTIKAMREKLGQISYSSLMRLQEADATFPRPIELTAGKRRKMWSEEAVDAWLEKKFSET